MDRERTEGFVNTYEDVRYAGSYAKLGFTGTYYLAFRDLPRILREHIRGPQTLDFGCGAGRSTRFLRASGFEVIGVDISDEMLCEARKLDPGGDYRLIEDGDFSQFSSKDFDLVLCAFPFDNIPTREQKVGIFRDLRRLLRNTGRIINIVSSPEIYTHEWVSFTAKDFPENKFAKSGDKVRIITKDFDGRRPAEDILWTDEAYREVYEVAGLQIVDTYKPLASGHEPYPWINETRIAPWVIYVLEGAPKQA